jgi:antitoxin VapB
MLEEDRRRVRLFINGRNQAVRIPREFELPGKEAVMSREGDRLVIEPLPRKTLLTVLAELKPVANALPDRGDAPPDPVSL